MTGTLRDNGLDFEFPDGGVQVAGAGKHWCHGKKPGRGERRTDF